ncbi:hypothetical protein V8D89_014984 [Ganoderma adspersum]
MLSSFPLFPYPDPIPHRLLVLAWFHDVHICLVVSLALLADSCSLPEERHWYEGGALRLESSYEVEDSEAGPKGAEDRLQRPVRSPRRPYRHPPKESCRSTLQAGARRYQLVCTLVPPPMSGEYSPRRRRSTSSASLELHVLSHQDASHPGGGGGVVNFVDVAVPTSRTDVPRLPLMQDALLAYGLSQFLDEDGRYVTRPPFHPAHSHANIPRRDSHGFSLSHLIYHPSCTTYHSPGSGTRRPITKDTTGDETIRIHFPTPALADRVDHSGSPTRLRLHLLDASMGTTCTYGGNGVLDTAVDMAERGGCLSSRRGQTVGRRPTAHCPPSRTLRRCEGCLGERKVEVLGDPVPADHACITDLASSCTHS